MRDFSPVIIFIVGVLSAVGGAIVNVNVAFASITSKPFWGSDAVGWATAITVIGLAFAAFGWEVLTGRRQTRQLAEWIVLLLVIGLIIVALMALIAPQTIVFPWRLR